ncbi:hypothetical protein EYC80_010192 [Monilinia laxa]|uniref:Chorismate mutase domain-containing protein n=1 Tax=Monilinia laxa TaxID=61186 RepID=A0A5N6JNH5_MONLA|nr:hypothetical protein EYC80_010192 [Monilinia laxa]
MKLTTLSPALLLALSTTATATATTDPASACYTSPLPPLSTTSANITRSIPWGSPSFNLPNGTTCCSSLDEVRAGINDLNDQIIALLAQRAAYVREATRFKATLDSVDVPSRDMEVIDGAVEKAKGTTPRLPETVARGVFEAIIEANVPFEKCVWESY